MGGIDGERNGTGVYENGGKGGILCKRAVRCCDCSASVMNE